MKLPLLFLAFAAQAFAETPAEKVARVDREIAAMPRPQRAPAREPIKQSSLVLTAALRSASAKAADRFKTDYGSYDLATTKERAVEWSVRNMGRSEADIELTVLWIGKYTASNERLLLKKDSRPQIVHPGMTQSGIAFSGTVSGTDLNLVMIGVRRVSGARIEGWVVTVRDRKTNDLLGLKASASHLEDLERSGNLPSK